jgi:ABC-2 type transport system permease protein
MSNQLRAIFWAQFRTIRNYLPRTGFGTVLMWLLVMLWYGLFCGMAVAVARWLPTVPIEQLPYYVSGGLLGVLLFWQIFPLMTLSTGWSLELNRLLIYPIRENTLFLVDLLLRTTTSPEMLFVLTGATVGLMLHKDVPAPAPLVLVAYILFNLLFSLAIREWMMRTFKRKKFRELFVIVFAMIAILPSVLVNTSLGARLTPVFFGIAKIQGTPWHELAVLATGRFSLLAVFVWPAWLTLAYLFARGQFAASIAGEARNASAIYDPGPRSWRHAGLEFLFALPSRLFRDPLAALLEKELRVLARAPRFRVIFAMACVFSLVIFYPVAFGKAGTSILASNYLPAVNSYGVLILGEVLLWNVFGFDRKATQIYFVAPVRFYVVLRAKNLVAVCTVFLMTVLISVLDGFIRRSTTLASLTSSLGLTAVITLFFLGVGNLTSVMNPRPIDPNQAFRNQNSAKASLWLLICFIFMTVPIGLAFVAKWAVGRDWAFFAVLLVDLLIGAIFYYVATESAVEKGEQERERVLDALSKGSGLMTT